jgi:hypothetical protein
VTGNPGVNHQVSRCDRRAQTDLWFDEANNSTGGMARVTDKPTRQMKVTDVKPKSEAMGWRSRGCDNSWNRGM